MSSRNVDRLSSLPEEIVSQILSLIPTQFAVRTSILSKRWRYSWMFVTNLDFDDIHSVHATDTLIEFVDRVMKFSKTPQLNLFRLHFSRRSIRKSILSNWINEAVKLKVHELDIDVFQIELPKSVFTCTTLTKLRLHHCVCDDTPFPINLPCLKTLDIVVHSDPSVNAFNLISGSPMLESLTIEVQRSDEEDYIFNIPTLKRLKLTVLCPWFTNKVVLNVPNLKCLFVGGILRTSFIMKNKSSLVEASASFHSIRNDYLWSKFLTVIRGVTSLSVNNIVSELPMCVFPNLRHLELKDSWNSGLILQFLERCPELKHLYIEKFADSPWTEPKLVPSCVLTSVTTIKFLICSGSNCDVKFMEYMLRNAEVLKSVTIASENSIIEEAWLYAQLLKIPKASRYCEIYLHGSKSRFTSN